MSSFDLDRLALVVAGLGAAICVIAALHALGAA